MILIIKRKEKITNLKKKIQKSKVFLLINIVNFKLQRTECDNQEVFDFMQLFKRPKDSIENDLNPWTIQIGVK